MTGYMDTDDWQRLARKRLESGQMTEEEWQSVTSALLIVSESEGIELFDDEITKLFKESVR